jgi:hypothetical protein
VWFVQETLSSGRRTEGRRFASAESGAFKHQTQKIKVKKEGNYGHHQWQ